MKKILLMIIAALAAAAPALMGAGPGERADSLMRASLGRLECRADSGDPEAMFRLANVLETGYGPLRPDSAKALRLYGEAADKGYAPALNYLGFKLFNGDGVSPDPDRGLSLIEKAALQGDPKGAANLGWLLVSGRKVVPDPEKAVYWLSKAADAGLPVAMMQLAAIYTEGLPPVAPDTLRAERLLIRAAKAGQHQADMRLRDLMARKWMDLSADSAVSLGARLYASDGAPCSAVELFRIAAAKGSARAEALLGEAFATGRGVEYDHDASVNAFYRAATMGNHPAQYILAELLDLFPDALADILGSGNNRSDLAETNAAYWYARAAEGGIADGRSAIEALIHEPTPVRESQ